MININDSIFSFVYDLNRGPETIFDLKGVKGAIPFVILAG